MAFMMIKSFDGRVFAAHALTITLWASAFVGIRVGLEAYTPEQLSLLRFLVGSALLAVVALIKRMPLPEGKDLPAIFVLGGLGFAAYHTALNYGERVVSAGNASLFVSTTPIFAALLSLICFRERLGLWKWIGSAVGFAGVGVISFATGDTLQVNYGALMILVASLAESLYFVWQKRYLEKYGFFAFTAFTIWAGTCCMLFFLPGLGTAIARAPAAVTLSVVYLGIFPTVVPYLALAYITSRVGASEATSSLYLTPVLAYVIAWIWLGEVPTVLAIAGGVITLIGVLLANGQGHRETSPVKLPDRSSGGDGQ